MKRYSQSSRHHTSPGLRIVLAILLSLTVFCSLRSQNINRLEYFFDSDPGLGAGTTMTGLTPSTDLTIVNYPISLAGLPQGFHRLYVRVRDENGRWSQTYSQAFLKMTVVLSVPNIVSAEYFIDSDPGYGQGTPVVITPSTDLTKNFAVDIAAISNGFHRLIFRVKDSNGKWSLNKIQAFYKKDIDAGSPANLSSIEYFYDTDPGFGNGHIVAVTPSPEITSMVFQPDFSGISAGQHTLFVRTKDATGKWSHSSHDTINVIIITPPGTSVTGNFSYQNIPSTPLNNAVVVVRAGNTVIATDTTGSNGEFSMNGIPEGNYTLSGMTDKPWGGVNSTDALLILQHFTGNFVLAGMQLLAADLNGSSYVNSLDALLAAKRFTGQISSFAGGDWISEVKTLIALGDAQQILDLKAICAGDVNGSYIPEARQKNGVEMVSEGTVVLEKDRENAIPLIAMDDLESGAISLVLDIPGNIRVSDVEMCTKSGNLVYHVEGNQLRIAWYSLEPIRVKAGEAIARLTVTAEKDAVADWISAEGSSIANGMGQTMPTVMLSMPRIVVNQAGLSLSGNYPNPFSHTTRICYSIPEEGFVSLKIYSNTGQEVETLVHEMMPAGNYSIAFKAGGASAGVYHCTLYFSGKATTSSQNLRMCIQK